MMNRQSNKRWLVAPMLLAVLGGGGYLAYKHVNDAAASTPPFRTQPARKDRIVATVTASGTLQPVKTVTVGSQVSGRVLELFADFNSVVKQGDLLARIDPRLFEADVARASANLASARASVIKARAADVDAQKNLERSVQLHDKGVIPQSELDTARSAVTTAAAQKTVAAAEVQQASAALEQAKTNLTLTEIHSPINGVVISRDVDVGQTVAASLQAPTLFTLAEDLRAMEVHTSVAESDVGALQPDQQVTFTVDAYPNERFRGVVTQIRNAPVTVQNVVTYDAVVRVDNTDLKLRPGMTANASFVVADRRDVLAIPSAALRFMPKDAPPAARGDRNARRVYVLENGKPRPVEIQTGASSGRLTEVTGGELAEGAQVITGAAGDDAAAAASPQNRQNQQNQQNQQRGRGAAGAFGGGLGGR